VRTYEGRVRRRHEKHDVTQYRQNRTDIWHPWCSGPSR